MVSAVSAVACSRAATKGPAQRDSNPDSVWMYFALWVTIRGAMRRRAENDSVKPTSIVLCVVTLDPVSQFG